MPAATHNLMPPPQPPSLYNYSSTGFTPSGQLPNLPSNSETESRLVIPSRSSIHKRRQDADHVRRPANPFILFACQYRKDCKSPNKSNRELSKEAGALWKVISEEERDVWKRRAELVKEKHAEDYPDYRYQPRRREGPRHPHFPLSEQDDRAGVVFLPPQSGSSPRKSNSRRSTRNAYGPAEAEADLVYTSINDTPSRQANELGADASSSKELSSVNKTSGTTLPDAMLFQSTQFTETAILPSSESARQLLSTGNDAFQELFGTWPNHPQQIEAARLSFEPFAISSIVPAVFDHEYVSGIDSSEPAQHQSNVANNSAFFFNEFDLSSYSDQYSAIRDSVDSSTLSFPKQQ